MFVFQQTFFVSDFAAFDFKQDFHVGHDGHLQVLVGMLFGKIQQLFVGGVGFDFDDVVGERLEHRVPALKNVNADQVAEARGIARIQNLRLDVENRGFQAVGIGNRLD